MGLCCGGGNKREPRPGGRRMEAGGWEGLQGLVPRPSESGEEEERAEREGCWWGGKGSGGSVGGFAPTTLRSNTFSGPG